MRRGFTLFILCLRSLNVPTAAGLVACDKGSEKMKSTKEKTVQRRTFETAALATVLLMLTGLLPVGVNAQAPGDSSEIPDLSGIWDRRGTTASSTMRLTARAIGFRDAFDHVLAPRYDCSPATSPFIIPDPYNIAVEQQPDRVLLLYEKDDVTRTVWLEGHGHPSPGAYDYTIQGHSIGRYEGDRLVVETTKFTFDPNGLANSGNVPSSTLKKVTEQYWREGDRLKVDVIAEDPLILLEPYRFTFEWERTEEALVSYGCNPEAARYPARFQPSKYKDPDWVRLPQ